MMAPLRVVVATWKLCRCIWRALQPISTSYRHRLMNMDRLGLDFYLLRHYGHVEIQVEQMLDIRVHVFLSIQCNINCESWPQSMATVVTEVGQNVFSFSLTLMPKHPSPACQTHPDFALLSGLVCARPDPTQASTQHSGCKDGSQGQGWPAEAVEPHFHATWNPIPRNPAGDAVLSKPRNNSARKTG